MKKKYVIHDEDGKEYNVEEIEETEEMTEKPEEKPEETHDEGLSSDEMAALKKLAMVADKLVELVSPKAEDSDEDIDEDTDIEKDKTEEVIDTDCDMKGRDSKASFNSIENRSKKVDDSIDPDEDVNRAWAKRYNGGK